MTATDEDLMLTRTAIDVHVVELVTFAEDAVLQFTDGADAVLERGSRHMHLTIRHDVIRRALLRLSSESCDLAELLTAIDFGAGITACLQWSILLDRLDRFGALDHLIVVGGEVVARLYAVSDGTTMLQRLAEGTAVLPEGFSQVRVDDGRLILKSAESHLAVELSPNGLGLWASGSGVADADGEMRYVPQLMRDVLFTAGVLVPQPGSAHPSAQWWSPAEWALHQQSRNPSTVTGFAATNRFQGRCEPPEPGVSFDPIRVQQLTVPDLESRYTQDPPLARVMEERRSRRHHDDAVPVTCQQLGELLYRTARYRTTFRAADGQLLVDRPIPAGGAIHELEVFPVVHRCAGMEAGLWHYNGSAHQLELVSVPSPATERILRSAASASVVADFPQVVLVLAADFGRLMYKYEAIGYTLIAKHVGVFQQSVYLVAEAMGLATCALGAGQSSAFADASGFAQLQLASVGEMTLGSRQVRIEGIADAVPG